MHTLYVGTYTHLNTLRGDLGMVGRGEGIYVLTFDDASGMLQPRCIHRGIANPSFLTLSPDRRRLFCVHELDTYRGQIGGAVSGYETDSTGRMLQRNATQPTQGASPCHLALSPAGDVLAVANYGGGSLSIFPVEENGSIEDAQVIQHEGTGPVADRQTQAHMHSAMFTPSGSHIIAADLGADVLRIYPVRYGSVNTDKMTSVPANPGDGPRMMRYSPDHRLLYVACELSCQIVTFAVDEAGLPTERIAGVPTLPQGAATAGATAADLSLSADGRFLYASTRGHNSLTVYAVSADGVLSPVQNILCGGRTPRAFALSPDGGWLLCANQDSDTVTLFKVDKEQGTLTPQSTFDLPSPVCLVFAP